MRVISCEIMCLVHWSVARMLMCAVHGYALTSLKIIKSPLMTTLLNIKWPGVCMQYISIFQFDMNSDQSLIQCVLVVVDWLNHATYWVLVSASPSEIRIILYYRAGSIRHLISIIKAWVPRENEIICRD